MHAGSKTCCLTPRIDFGPDGSVFFTRKSCPGSAQLHCSKLRLKSPPQQLLLPLGNAGFFLKVLNLTGKRI